ncbi:MAG TPA: hypothetical protein VI636_09610 [Candidatus Angelobacter sp.]
MSGPEDRKPYHHKRWPKEARQLVADYLDSIRDRNADEPTDLRLLTTRLVMLTGNSREACRRFARQLGVRAKQPYRAWTKADQQKLLDLIVANPPHEVARIMRRTPGAIRVMLHRLGANAQMGRDWFTKYILAEALHLGVVEVQRWIDRGWLKARIVETGRLKKEIIDADDFAAFCKQYRGAIVGRRLNADRLEFVQKFVFPPSHTELLPVRESKKERAAYEAQIGGTRMPAMAADFEESEDGGSLATA